MLRHLCRCRKKIRISVLEVLLEFDHGLCAQKVGSVELGRVEQLEAARRRISGPFLVRPTRDPRDPSHRTPKSALDASQR